MTLSQTVRSWTRCFLWPTPVSLLLPVSVAAKGRLARSLSLAGVECGASLSFSYLPGLWKTGDILTAPKGPSPCWLHGLVPCILCVYICVRVPPCEGHASRVWRLLCIPHPSVHLCLKSAGVTMLGLVSTSSISLKKRRQQPHFKTRKS